MLLDRVPRAAHRLEAVAVRGVISLQRRAERHGEQGSDTDHLHRIRPRLLPIVTARVGDQLRPVDNLIEGCMQVPIQPEISLTYWILPSVDIRGIQMHAQRVERIPMTPRQKAEAVPRWRMAGDHDRGSVMWHAEPF